MEADGQGDMEPVLLCDDCSDEYQMAHPGDESKPDIEPEGENSRCGDETTPRRRREPRWVETRGNNHPRTVRTSTNTGS